jgi:hypothetical protein
MTPISFELFAALGLYSTKPEILWQLLKGLKRYGNWRIKMVFAWLLISIIYLMSFPRLVLAQRWGPSADFDYSLLDACSGYEASQIANFKWPNGTVSNSDGLAGYCKFSGFKFDAPAQYRESTHFPYHCYEWQDCPCSNIVNQYRYRDWYLEDIFSTLNTFSTACYAFSVWKITRS